MNHVGTKRSVARGLFHIKAIARFEPLTVFVDQTDKCDWRIEECGSQTCNSIKPLVRVGIQDPQCTKRRQAPFFVRWNSPPDPPTCCSQNPRAYLGSCVGTGKGLDQPVGNARSDPRSRSSSPAIMTTGSRCSPLFSCRRIARHVSMPSMRGGSCSSIASDGRSFAMSSFTSSMSENNVA